MTLGGIANWLDALLEQVFQHTAAGKGSSANQEIVRRISPVFAQPFDVGLKTAGGNDHRSRGNDDRCAVLVCKHLMHRAVYQTQRLDFGIVANVHANAFRMPVVSIQHGFAAAQKERVRPRQAQGPAQ